jgi:hypothetical protein
VTAKQKPLIREFPEGHKGREVARRKPGKLMIFGVFTSRSFASFADKKDFPA